MKIQVESRILTNQKEVGQYKSNCNLVTDQKGNLFKINELTQ